MPSTPTNKSMGNKGILVSKIGRVDPIEEIGLVKVEEYKSKKVLDFAQSSFKTNGSIIDEGEEN